MGSNTVKLGLSILLGGLLLVGLVDLAAAAAPGPGAIPQDHLTGVSSQVVTLPTPFPTPPVYTLTTEIDTAFWDVTNYEGAVSAFQTLFLLQGVQDLIVIIGWIGVLALSIALVRGIIAAATSGEPSNDEGV